MDEGEKKARALKQNARNARWRERHPEWVEAFNKRHREEVREKYRSDPKYRIERSERSKMTHARNRALVIEAYGGRCEVCGISELRFLTLDHSFQDGKDHRKRIGGSSNIYADIVRRGFPRDEGYRVLCWNHNCGGAW